MFADSLSASRAHRPLIKALIILTLSGFVSFEAHAATPAKEAPQNQAPSANAIAQTAAQKGAPACLERINAVTNFLGYSPKAGVMMMLPPSQVGQRILPVTMAIQTAPTSIEQEAYVSATFAPNQVNGCGATYDAVVYWPQKCEIVAEKQFSSLKKAGTLGKKISFLDGGLATKVFLMPAGTGCVSIKKEVVL